MTEATDVVPVKKPGKVKKPTDHKPKVEKPKVEKVDGARLITHRGLTVKIPDAAFTDYRVLKAVAAIQKGEVLALPDLLVGLVGEDGEEAVLNHLADKETGRPDLTAVAPFLTEIFVAANPNS